MTWRVQKLLVLPKHTQKKNPEVRCLHARAHNWTIRVHGLSPIDRSLDAWPHGHWPSWISSLPASAYTAWPVWLLPRAAHITTRRSKSPIVPPSWPAYLVHSVIRDLLSKYSQVWPQSALDTGPSLFATSARAYWRNLIHFVQMTTDFPLHERDLIRSLSHRSLSS